TVGHLDRLPGARLVDIGEKDARALLGQHQHGGATDPGGSPGHHHGLVLEQHGGLLRTLSAHRLGLAPARKSPTRRWVSCVPSRRPVHSVSAAKPSRSGSRANRKHTLQAASANGCRPATFCASSLALASSSARGTAHCTIPSSRALLPSTVSALRMTRAATAGPAIQVSRCVPPPPGRRPSPTSGKPSLASLAAMRKSQPSASSSPPPMAAPPISARLTCGRSEMRWNSSWNGRVTLAAASILSAAEKCVEISARSAPAEKALRAERMCSTLQSPRAARSSKMAWKALNMSALKAFTGARLSVAVAIRSATFRWIRSLISWLLGGSGRGPPPHWPYPALNSSCG